jgi:thioredoxin reductase
MDFEVIIIGGSYAGLAAATTLGRALRKVLVIDGGKPCNRQTPHSHNFLTRDGETPAAIADKAKEQLAKYKTVQTVTDFVIDGSKQQDGFKMLTLDGHTYTAQKLVFATGITDVMPPIMGFAKCWGISVIHCPYCHGYEVHHQPTGILANGDMGFDFAKLVSNWTDELTLFTNGASTLIAEQIQKIKAKNINIVEDEVQNIVHEDGRMKSVILQGDQEYPLTALYARLPFMQHSDLPKRLGCEFTDAGYIAVDGFNRTNIPGVYAAGDNASPMRAVANAVAAGVLAGASINKEMIDDGF